MVCITRILNFATSDSFRGDGSHILYSRFYGTLSLTLATIFTFPAYSAHQCIDLYIRYLPSYLPIHTNIHTYIHAYTHTYTYIQTDSIICSYLMYLFKKNLSQNIRKQTLFCVPFSTLLFYMSKLFFSSSRINSDYTRMNLQTRSHLLRSSPGK